MSTSSVYDHGIDTLAGEHLALGVFRGLPLLIVNLGTRGPHADQITGLQELHDSFSTMGLTVVGIPSNDFGGEPGELERIRDRLTLDFRATFLLSLPLRVAGPRPSPLFRTLTAFQDRPVRSDAEKFVVDGDGYVVERFGPDVRPGDAALMGALKFVLPTLGY
jgi:glutathione peroxidase